MDPNIYKHIINLSKATVVYDKFCFRMKCPEFRAWEWDYDGSPCLSCNKIGETYQIEKYPEDCLHKDEIEKLTVIARLTGKRRVE